jgi:hypothetical protein
MSRIRSRLTFANVVSLIALFVALGGTAIASVIITSNSQVASNTISGHHPPSGKHSNLISGSVNGMDLADGAVTRAKLKTPATFTSAGLSDSPQPNCGGSQPDGWLNNEPSVNARVGFYRDASGFVYLRGATINCTDLRLGGPILTLPDGYKPAKRHVFAVAANPSGAQTGLVVEPDGSVNPSVPGANKPLFLDGVLFRCGPSGQNGCP